MCDRTVASEQFSWRATSSAGRPSTSLSTSAERSRALSNRRPSSRYSDCSPRKQQILRAVLRLRAQRLVHFFQICEKLTPPVPPKKIDGCVGGNSGQPVGGLVEILDLILPLQRFDEGFLRQILSVVHVPDDAVDLQEDAAEVVLNEPLLRLANLWETPSPAAREYLAASLILPPGRDWLAILISPKND